ncbi:MAG: hypothetical protein LM517_09640 [Nitrosomonas sp.]|nr:hypothetical protein [Nitrosomonas sp.]
MTKIIYFGGSKGGTGKTTTSHLFCLGAILWNQPAAYVLTDPERKVRGEGRPYAVLDGRNPSNLANILSAAQNSLNGWLIIDGGGNRPALDQEISNFADLSVLTFRPSEEDLDTVATDLSRLSKAVAWPTAWPTNAFAQRAAQFYIDGLCEAFPNRVILNPIPFVNSVSELLGSSLNSPSQPVRSVSKKVFCIIEDFIKKQIN